MVVWDGELAAAVPPLTVAPHLRVRCIHDIAARRACSFANGQWFEEVAHVASGGHLRHYMQFVRQATTDVDPNDFEALCQSADGTQVKLSDADAKRHNVLGRLHAMDFQCTEVPEANQSSRVCQFCGHHGLLTRAEQRRSADEGQTIVYKCRSKTCGKSFT